MNCLRIISLITIATVAWFPSCKNNDGWKRVYPEEKNYSIELPGESTFKKGNVESLYGPAVSPDIYQYAEINLFLIHSHYHFPYDMTDSLRLIDFAREIALQFAEAEVLKEERFFEGDMEIIKINLLGNNEGSKVTFKIMVADKDVYTVVASVAKGFYEQKRNAIDRFLNSFRLESR